jgi:hypothetical protein
MSSPMAVFIESCLFTKLVFFYKYMIYIYKISIWQGCLEQGFDFNLGFRLIIKKGRRWLTLKKRLN